MLTDLLAEGICERIPRIMLRNPRRQIMLPILVKILILQAIFIVLHYLYKWQPCRFTSILGGINESVYQHMKMCFFAYILFTLIEFAIFRRSLVQTDQYLFSRLFSATFYPLVLVVIYYFGPLVFGHFKKIGYEIFFANIALLVSSYAILVIEKQIETSKHSLAFKWIVSILFILSLVEFIGFTRKLPWLDVFKDPAEKN